LKQSLLYTKILEGLQQKLEGLEPLSPIAGVATDRSLAATNCIILMRANFETKDMRPRQDLVFVS